MSSLNVEMVLLPGEQGVEIVWCGRVGAQGRGGDVGSCLGPVLAPIVGTVCSQACSDWLSVDHSAWKSNSIITSDTQPGVCFTRVMRTAAVFPVLYLFLSVYSLCFLSNPPNEYT